MLYLTNADGKILWEVNKVLSDLFHEGKLTKEQEIVLARFYQLRKDSETYTVQCRNKAKKFVQEKRKTNKSYAHKRKEN